MFRNRFNVKNIKPKDLDKPGLERSLHAPSPLITGKLTSMADSRNQLLNSPDVRLGPGVVKRNSKFGNQQPSAIEESSDDVDAISDEKNLINQNINKYQNGLFNHFLMRKNEGPTSNSSSMNNQINGFNKPIQETKTTHKKALNAQTNLLDFLKKNTPESNVQFTLSSHQKKVSTVKNNLRDFDQIPDQFNSNNNNKGSNNITNNNSDNQPGAK